MFLINIRLKNCVTAILENGGMLESVPSRCKTQEMCIIAVNSLFPIDIRSKKFVIKLLMKILMH